MSQDGWWKGHPRTFRFIFLDSSKNNTIKATINKFFTCYPQQFFYLLTTAYSSVTGLISSFIWAVVLTTSKKQNTTTTTTSACISNIPSLRKWQHKLDIYDISKLVMWDKYIPIHNRDFLLIFKQLKSKIKPSFSISGITWWGRNYTKPRFLQFL